MQCAICIRIAPGPRHFNKEQTPLGVWCQLPTHGFTVAVSVFWGTPPAKPLDCKIRLKSSGAPWQRPARIRAGGEPRLSRAASCFLAGDIVQMPSRIRLTVFAFRFKVRFIRSRAIKNPACVAASRVGNVLDPTIASPACPRPVWVIITGPAQSRPRRQAPAEHPAGDLGFTTRRSSERPRRPHRC